MLALTGVKHLRLAVAAACFLFATPVQSATPSGADGPQIAGCPTLPADNIWNSRVDQLPVHQFSSAYLASIGTTYADESDPGPYPIPSDAPIEGGPNSTGDRHVLVVDRDNCVLYETFDAHPNSDGSWSAGSACCLCADLERAAAERLDLG